MPDEKTQFWITGIVITALAGLYGFFVRHLIGHTNKADISSQIDQLWERKQDTKSCEQIVKRIDENHKEQCKKLDRILEKLGQ